MQIKQLYSPFQRWLLLAALPVMAMSVIIAASIMLSKNTGATDGPTPDACFIIDVGTSSITGYYNTEGGDATAPACTKDVVIPPTINGVSITNIGNSSFSNQGLTSVTIPSSVTSIGSYAFGSNQLTSITIPSGVTSIGDTAFYFNQLSSATISSTVTSIGAQAFYSNQLTSVTIPSSVTSIGSGAFQSNNITTMTILGTPSSLGSDILLDDPIDTIIYGGVTYSPSQPGQPVPSTCFDHDGDMLTAYYYKDLRSVVKSGIMCAATDIDIPQSMDGVAITKIANSALTKKHLSSVTIPSSVTDIGNDAFSSNSLTSIAIPGGVTSIGNDAFLSNKLTSLVIPSSVTHIGDYSFTDNLLSSLVIPSSVTIIGNGAFSTNSLTSVTIPSGVTSIGGYAFYANQLTSVTIPSSVTNIGNDSFHSNKLTSVTIPSGVTNIGSYAFYDNQLTSVTIPSSVTNIGYGTFQSNAITTITLQGTPSTINADAFSSNPLVSVIYNGVTYLANQPVQPACFSQDNDTLTGYHFMDFMVLINSGALCAAKSIDIPQSLNGVTITKIGVEAFYDQLLTSVTLPSSITSIGDSAFAGNLLTSITLPSSVTDISNYAFANNKLTSISIPSGVTTISDGLLYNNQLSSITLPNGVTSVGDSAFYNNNLSSLTIPSSVTNISSGAFFDNNITSLVVPDSVASLGNYVFAANQLTSLTLGCGVDTIGEEMYAINKLTEVTVPDCIKTINPTAFFGQNPWGGTIDQGADPAHYWYSADPSVLQLIHDSLWYVQLRTASSNNPNHLTDGVVDEAWYAGDLDGNGTQTDSIGGHLINPAMTTTHYVDESGTHILASTQTTGRLSSGADIADYLIKNVPTPGFVDAESPTSDEQAALEVSLSQYHRFGQNISLTAPLIAGYALHSPTSPHIINLISPTNDVTFVYSTVSTNTPGAVPSPTLTPPAEGSAPQTPSVSVAPKVSSSASTNETESSPPLTPADEQKASRVDFSALSGSIENPTTGSAAQGLGRLMAKSSFQTDTSKSCHEIDSAQLLSAHSFTSPDAQYISQGGLTFQLKCSTSGGDASVTFTLGDTIPNFARVKVYKRSVNGHDTDITRQVHLVNQGSGTGTRTTISYDLRDGQAFDDDGVSNSRINDPIFIALLKDTIATPFAKQSAPSNTTPLSKIVTALIVVIGVTSVIIVRIRRRHQ